eukprot:4390260-Pleurochrysis_carterae.AAC.1
MMWLSARPHARILLRYVESFPQGASPARVARKCIWRTVCSWLKECSACLHSPPIAANMPKSFTSVLRVAHGSLRFCMGRCGTSQIAGLTSVAGCCCWSSLPTTSARLSCT